MRAPRHRLAWLLRLVEIGEEQAAKSEDAASSLFFRIWRSRERRFLVALPVLPAN